MSHLSLSLPVRPGCTPNSLCDCRIMWSCLDPLWHHLIPQFGWIEKYCFNFGAVDAHLVDAGTKLHFFLEPTSRASWGKTFEPPAPAQANGAPPRRYTRQAVLEADCRDRQRNLKLWDNEAVHSTFFSNLSLPFRFAINLHHPSVSVTIHSLSFTAKPTLQGGRKEIKIRD
ncbi:hypothetical protein BLNAU_13417 [Blattamonas nauphoetae]|uniref:Uncharacterized protein n=1 Tax=Blattamonas nauphoetae TaxID=2049346 RepID=A0ABQ9XK04_9EUKA|nr:hypothetical protein BLNAU_13417 [Blattamonas nauphoetae]